MTRVILIRHAKSSWEDPFGDDHARPLNVRGRANANAMGAWLKQMGYLPDVILSSDAERTQETATRLGFSAPITLRPELYHASPDTMLAALQSAQANTVAMIAHNPGMAMLAGALVELRPDHPRFGDYPTCAVTVIDFTTQIAPHMGRCVDFKIPRELP